MFYSRTTDLICKIVIAITIEVAGGNFQMQYMLRGDVLDETIWKIISKFWFDERSNLKA